MELTGFSQGEFSQLLGFLSFPALSLQSLLLFVLQKLFIQPSMVSKELLSFICVHLSMLMGGVEFSMLLNANHLIIFQRANQSAM